MDSRVDIKAMRSDARLKVQGEAIADAIAQMFGLKPPVQVSKPKPPEVAELPDREFPLPPHAEAWMRAEKEGLLNGKNPAGNVSREQLGSVLKRDREQTEQMVRRLIQEIVFGADREVSEAHREKWEEATAAGLVIGEQPGADVPREQLTTILEREGVISDGSDE